MVNKKTILVIDDEKDLNEMIAFQLQAKGFEVIPAYNGLEGLERLKTIIPDFIILDMNMPRMGGIEFLKNISDQHARLQSRVFVLTARANMEHLFNDIQVAGFMAKPFEIDALIAAVGDAINKKRPEDSVDQSRSDLKANPFLDEKVTISVQDEDLLRMKMLEVDPASRGRLDPDNAGKKTKEDDQSFPMNETRRGIIILEDDAVLAHRLKDAISRYGRAVYLLTTVEECLEKTAHEDLDLIILKHFLKDSNMEDLACRLKVAPKLFRVPIIIYDYIRRQVVDENLPAEKSILAGEEWKEVLKKVEMLLGR